MGVSFARWALLASAAGAAASVGCRAPRPSPEETASNAAVRSPVIGEQIDTQPESGQLWFDRKTTDQVTAIVGNGNRLLSIQVATPPPNLTFSGTFVPNSGTYFRTSYWYPALTVQQLQLFTEVLSARPISLDMYEQNGTTMFATVLVSNNGAESQGWWFYTGSSLTDLNTMIQQKNARLIDWRREGNGSTGNFVALMVSNTGPDMIQWWKYPALTTDQINANLTANNAILVSIAPADTVGQTFDVVMNQSPADSIGWGWYRDLTLSEFTGVLSQNQVRPVDFKSYLVNGQWVYSTITVQNTWSATQQSWASCDASVVASWQANPPATGVGTPATMAAYDCEVTKFMQRMNSPGASVAVTQNGRLVLARAYGFADRDELRIIHPDNLLRVASISKTITAAAVLRLTEPIGMNAPLLHLTDQVFPILGLTPNPNPPGGVDHSELNTITVEELLWMSAGWTSEFNDMVSDTEDFKVETAQNLQTGVCSGGVVTCGQPPKCTQLIQYMLSRPDSETLTPNSTPGTVYNYSNFSYCVLGALIEKVTGTDYGTWVTNNLLSQAGAADIRPGQTLGTQDREVTYYSSHDFGLSVFEPPPTDSNAQTQTTVYRSPTPNPGLFGVPSAYGDYYVEGSPAGGGWIASAVDLMRFDVQLAGLNGKTLIAAPEFATMIAPSPANSGTGMGLFIDGSDGPTKGNLGHAGAIDGDESSHVIAGYTPGTGTQPPNGFTFTLLLNTGPADDPGSTLNLAFYGNGDNTDTCPRLNGPSSSWFSGDLFDQYGPYTAWMTGSQYQSYYNAQVKNGLYPSRVDAINHTGTTMFRAVFAPFKGASFESHHSLNCVDYQATDARLKAAGYTVTSLQSHVQNDGTRRYEGTWVKWSACSPSCTDGSACTGSADCQSGVCTNGVCQPPSCAPTCGGGAVCGSNSDCASNQCMGGKCSAPSCAPTCPNGTPCSRPGDCATSVCTAGKCAPQPCATAPGKCSQNNPCGANSDCGSGVCANGVCQPPTCAPGCPNGRSCNDAGNCASFTCSSSFVCVSPPCATQPGKCQFMAPCGQNSDCGAGICMSNVCQHAACATTCPNGAACNDNSDCGSKVCSVTTNLCVKPACSPNCVTGQQCGANSDCKSPRTCKSGTCQ